MSKQSKRESILMLLLIWSNIDFLFVQINFIKNKLKIIQKIIKQMSLQRLDTTKEAVLQGGDYEIQSMRVVPDTALYNENQTIKR